MQWHGIRFDNNHPQRALILGPENRYRYARAKHHNTFIAEEENREPMGEIKMNPPITIIHTQDDGARLREIKSLNKLPFKNRNSAL